MLTALPHSVFSKISYGLTTNVKGTITPGTPTPGTTTGSMSAARPSDIARLEEGKRTRQAFMFFTSDTLHTARQGGQMPDRIQNGSDWFEVDQLMSWANAVMNHNEYLIVKIENP